MKMKNFTFSLVTALVFLVATSNAQASVQVFFNQDDTKVYVDPVRKVYRQGVDFQTMIVNEIQKATSSIEVAVQEFRLSAIAQALIEKQEQGVQVRVIIDSRYNNTIWEALSSDQLQNQQKVDLYEMDEAERDLHTQRLYQLRELAQLLDSGQISDKEDPLYVDAIELLRNSDVVLIDDTADGSGGNNLMHHKYVVIDNQKLILTSANFTVHDFFGIPNGNDRLGNANALFLIEDKSLTQLFLDEFNYMFGSEGPKVGEHHRPLFGLNKPHRDPKVRRLSEDMIITTQFAPTSRRLSYAESTAGLMKRSLLSAEESISAALFVFSDQVLADAIKTVKRERGIELSVLVDRLFAYRYYSKALDLLGLTLPRHDCQFQAGINPWSPPARRVGIPELSGDKLHHKFAVIDNRKVVFGSQNWSSSGNHNNDEFLVVIENEQVAQEFTREIERLNNLAHWGALPWVYERIEQQFEACGLAFNH